MKAHREESGDKTQSTPDKIYQLAQGNRKAQIIKSAIQLDVFNLIASGLHTTEAIVAAKNWEELPLCVLLDSLCPLGFLTKKGGQYQLTPVSEAFLVSSSESYLGDWYLSELASNKWEQLAKAVRTGQRQILDVCSPELAADWAQDAAAEVTRISRIAESFELWRAVGIDPQTTQDLRVLDLASGSGIVSFVLARHNPNVKITCIDWAEVLQVAEKLANKWKILKQVDFQPGNLMTMDFGKFKFDVVLLSWVTYFWGPEQNNLVFNKVYHALVPGGKVVIQADMADEERCNSESLIFAINIFLESEKGKIYTFSEYKAMLEKAGFSQIVTHSETLISARK